MHRRRFLCCGAAAAAGLFTSLSQPASAMLSNPCEGPLPPDLHQHPLVARCFEGIAANQLWDVHAHLLGTGDAGSGCRINPTMTQWWHPVESLRRR